MSRQQALKGSGRKKQQRTTKRSCDKRRYRDHGEAIQALRRVRADSVRDIVPCRAYECHRCGGWHLTSQAS